MEAGIKMALEDYMGACLNSFFRLNPAALEAVQRNARHVGSGELRWELDIRFYPERPAVNTEPTTTKGNSMKKRLRKFIVHQVIEAFFGDEYDFRNLILRRTMNALRNEDPTLLLDLRRTLGIRKSRGKKKADGIQFNTVNGHQVHGNHVSADDVAAADMNPADFI